MMDVAAVAGQKKPAIFHWLIFFFSGQCVEFLV
jgi:hypothetical protein